MTPRIRRRIAFAVALASASLLVACGVKIDARRPGFPCDPDGGCATGLVCRQGTCEVPDQPGADGGATDGGTTDGGVTDGGGTDAGVTDGGAGDGGITDGGIADGGQTDGGPADGGMVGPVGLRFEQEPTPMFAGQTWSPPVAVALVDAQGQVVTSGTGTITLALGGQVAGSTLGGAVTHQATAGVAIFPDLTVLTPIKETVTLTASAPGLAPATSQSFTVTPCNTRAVLAARAPGGGTTALPWDTITLDPTGSLVCGGASSVTYSVSPIPADGGFAPWGQFGKGSASPGSPLDTMAFYTPDPGTYTFTLSVHDPVSGKDRTSTATVQVGAFAPLPYDSTVAPGDSRALALDRFNGTVLVATTSGTPYGAFAYQPTTLPNIVMLPCLSGHAGSSATFDGGTFWVGFDDISIVDQITRLSGGLFQCQVTKFQILAQAGQSPSRTRGLTFDKGVVYAATDRDLFGLTGGATH